MSDIPWEGERAPIQLEEPTMLVDVRRCIGCHACSVACKVEHAVPLGEFRMRVRWMEDPSDGRMAFLPVFDAATCDHGEGRRAFGLPPACVSACPTAALTLAAAADVPTSARPLEEPGSTKPGVRYIGHEPWQEKKLNAGAALHPDDEDILYEQGYGR
ncbi:MAG: hypothetical protein QNK04_15420 [Myxococcota bacterium]|nr:hypothetical protein [Myxococcota bacterium]